MKTHPPHTDTNKRVHDCHPMPAMISQPTSDSRFLVGTSTREGGGKGSVAKGKEVLWSEGRHLD